MKSKYLLVILFLMAATMCEAFGDAIIRRCLFEYVGLRKASGILIGGILLVCYGLLLNLAPMPFHRVVGIYIATLFIVWQVVSFITFRSLPSIPVITGGTLIVAGGLIVAFWNAALSEPH